MKTFLTTTQRVINLKTNQVVYDSRSSVVRLTFVSHPFSPELFSQTKSSLFDESFQRMELTRPYICESNTTIGGFSSNVTNNTLTVSLLVRSLEVQAFDFPNGANFTPNGRS